MFLNLALPHPFSKFRGRNCCGTRLGALKTRVMLSFALPGFPGFCWRETVVQRGARTSSSSNSR